MDNNMPKLSVAENKYGEIVHIRDVDEERRKKEDFTCPICNGKVKARAVTDTACVQPHFYHVEGKCGGESEGHWMFKNWLLKEGTEFTIQSKDKNEKYTVKSIELEKVYKTNFGKYVPDITVNTKEGKTILFEIRFSSKKTNDEYLLKWQELELDIVEVNAKKLMNEDYNQEGLTFDIIYSDGKSYVSTYKGRDRKIFDYKSELKRQDKLNYKARWMQLDWIYVEFKRLFTDFTEENQEKIIESFTALETEDKKFVFDSVKKHKLGSLKNELSIIFDNDFYDGIWDLYKEVYLIFYSVNEVGNGILELKKGKKYFTLKVKEINRYGSYNQMVEVYKENKEDCKLKTIRSKLLQMKNYIPTLKEEIKRYKREEEIRIEKESIEKERRRIENLKSYTKRRIKEHFFEKIVKGNYEINNSYFRTYYKDYELRIVFSDNFLKLHLIEGISYEDYKVLYYIYCRNGVRILYYEDIIPQKKMADTKKELDKKLNASPYQILKNLERDGVRILQKRTEGK